MEAILVFNAGSSSVKFQAFKPGPSQQLERLVKGQVDGIGTRPRLKAISAVQNGIDRTFDPVEIADGGKALEAVSVWLSETHELNLIAVGHRVVHGGPRYSTPVLVTPHVLASLEALSPLAPLHQPNNLAPIRALMQSRPNMPQVACFDTAFHRDHPALADVYAIPARYHDSGIRRYGFHGLSYDYIAGQLPEVAPALSGGRVIVAHLGSGASMCALKGGRSVECTMGFTTLDGLPMGTRPGRIDPGVVLYLQMQEGLSPVQVQDMLYRDCGLKGLSGISNDVRDLEASHDPRAAFALDYFAYRAACEIGALTAALGGLDGLVFTAGIGENSASVRENICRRLGWLGISLDADSNARHAKVISTNRSLLVLVLATDEELMIARQTQSLLGKA